MDDCLERILSILPRNVNGKFARGCKKELADYLGLPHNTVAEWISGRNKSYLKYLYQIAEKYNVTVEWLKCETDEKNSSPISESGIPYPKEYVLLNETNRAIVDRLIADLAKGQSNH